MNIGDKAPEILGLNEKGEEIRLSNYKGKKIVLYFYPKDMTCLLYTSPSPRDRTRSRMPSSA